VKMVHNGIEYGIMASYAEGLNILRHADVGDREQEVDAETTPLRDPQYYQFDIDVAEVAEVWRRGSVVGSWLVDLTADGSLRLEADLAASRFPSDAVAAVLREGALWLIPLRGPSSGGLLLKQRNPAGDRAALVREVLGDGFPPGVHRAFWDDTQKAMRIPLDRQ